jgi:hypothetical protein
MTCTDHIICAAAQRLRVGDERLQAVRAGGMDLGNHLVHGKILFHLIPSLELVSRFHVQKNMFKKLCPSCMSFTLHLERMKVFLLEFLLKVLGAFMRVQQPQAT